MSRCLISRQGSGHRALRPMAALRSSCPHPFLSLPPDMYPPGRQGTRLQVQHEGHVVITCSLWRTSAPSDHPLCVLASHLLDRREGMASVHLSLDLTTSEL